MRAYTLSHLGDQELLRAFDAALAHERGSTAAVLAHIAEVDARRLYLPAGYPSMHAFCVRARHLSEDAAYKRIRAARAAHAFPVIFEAVADGRLSLSVVGLLAPRLQPENARGLLEASFGRSKFEVEQMLATRFPESELLELVQSLPEPVPETVKTCDDELAPGRVAGPDEPAPARVATHSIMKPHAAGRYALQLVVGQATFDKLQHARVLLSHALPSGEIAEVLDRALDVLIARLERRKFGAARTSRRAKRRASANPRHIPAHAKRAVFERDGGACTFVSETGQRCGSRELIEYDHVDPVARGGMATVEGLRLRCRAHNQYEAERVFGVGFMEQKRARAEEMPQARSAPPVAFAPAAPTAPTIDEFTPDVLAGLRELHVSADDAKRAAAYAATTSATTLEARIRAALQFLGARHRAQKAG